MKRGRAKITKKTRTVPPRAASRTAASKSKSPSGSPKPTSRDEGKEISLRGRGGIKRTSREEEKKVGEQANKRRKVSGGRAQEVRKGRAAPVRKSPRPTRTTRSSVNPPILIVKKEGRGKKVKEEAEEESEESKSGSESEGESIKVNIITPGKALSSLMMSPKDKENRRKQKEQNRSLAKSKKGRAKLPKTPITKFKKGVFNPDMQELVEVDKEREDKSSSIFELGNKDVNNRNSIRAVLTNNSKLLENTILHTKEISSIYDTWGPEVDMNSVDYAIKYNNTKMLHTLLATKTQGKSRAPREPPLLSEISAGKVGFHAFGVHTRGIQMSRGNRQGNNAFMQKCISNTPYSNQTKSVMRMLANPNLEFDTVKRLIILNPGMDYELNNHIVTAVLAGNREMAGKLVKRIQNLSNYGFNQLHYDVLAKNTGTANVHKASLGKKPNGNDGMTPTHAACINPHAAVIKSLIAQGSNINITDNMQRKPVHYAAACTSPEILKEVVALGGNLNDLDIRKKTTLIYACMAGRGANIIYILGQAPALGKLKDKQGMGGIHYACKYGHLEGIRALAESEVNLKLGGGRDRLMPIGFTAAYNHYECTEYLIQEGTARILGKDKYKRSPLVMAVRNGNTKIVSLLLKHGALFNDVDSSNNTPLHYAMAYGWSQIFDILLKAGADKNATNSWKITPLGIGMLMNQYGMVRKLLDEPDVDVNCKDENGRTMLSLAMDKLNLETINQVHFLLDVKHADPNIPDLNGNTPLHHLVLNPINIPVYEPMTGLNITPEEIVKKRKEIIEKKTQMTRLLLKFGCDMNKRNKQGKSILSLCLTSQIYEMTYLFVSCASFATNPHLLFSFPNIIYSPHIFELFKTIIGQEKPSVNNINVVNKEGYTPLLAFIKSFIGIAQSEYSKISAYLTYELKRKKVIGAMNFELDSFNITYEKYQKDFTHKPEIEEYYLPPSDYQLLEEYSRTYWESTIVGKFIEIVEMVIDLGADLGACVQKLKKYRRGEDEDMGLGEKDEDEDENEEANNNLQTMNPFGGGMFGVPNPNQQKLPVLGGTVKEIEQYGGEGKRNIWHFVVQYPHPQLVAFLAKHTDLTIPFQERDKYGYTPIRLLLDHCSQYQSQMIKFMHEHHVDINSKDDKGLTPLMSILLSNNISLIKRMLEEFEGELELETVDNELNFPLLLAVKNRNLELTRLLLSHGADINQLDSKLRTVLHHAVEQTDPDMEETGMEDLLIEYSANPNMIDHRGRSALHYAFVKMGNFTQSSRIDPIESVSTLCSFMGIKLDIEDEWGKTPLHYAAQRGSTISTVLLLSRGAELDAIDTYGNTPLSVAFLYGHPDYSIMLLEKGASVNIIVHPERPKMGDKGKKKMIRYKEGDEGDEVDEGDEGDEDEEEDSEEEDNLIEQQNVMFGRRGKGGKGFGKKRAAVKNINFGGGGLFGNQMMNTNINNNQNSKPNRPNFNNQKVKEEMGLFRLAIQQEWQGILYLLLDKKYDYMLGMQDAIAESKFKLMLKLLQKTPNDGTACKFNEKMQNLLHILAMYSSAASYMELRDIYGQLSRRKIKHSARDVRGRTALHYAAETHNSHLIRLLLHEKYDPNELDTKGDTPVALMFRGGKITSSLELAKIVIGGKGNLNITYSEPYYAEIIGRDLMKRKEDIEGYVNRHPYDTTPLIHAIRYAHEGDLGSTKPVEELIRVLLMNRCDASKQDSEGRDAFMHCAILNDTNLLKIVLKYARGVVKNLKDIYGKTVMHYAVKQFEFASYENSELLNECLQAAFEYNLPDTEGYLPVDYAFRQSSQKLYQVFNQYGIESNMSESQIQRKLSYLEEDEWKLVTNIESDSKAYCNKMDQIYKGKKEEKVKPDNSGNFSPQFKVVYDDNLGPYDAYMHKVNIKNGTFGEYLFYKMQLLIEENRDVYVVFTRWGRIGEIGANQRTPFGTLEEAKTEFSKIFKQKTSNEWGEKDNFAKSHRKYNLIELKKRTNYKEYLTDFNHKHPIVESELSKKCKEIMEQLTSLSIYQSFLNNQQISSDQMPLSKLSLTDLRKAQDLLDEIREIIQNQDKEAAKGYNAGIEKMMGYKEELLELSSRYYELVPSSRFVDTAPQAIEQKYMLSNEDNKILNLINIEKAVKIFLGAAHRINEINPMDYCLKSLDTFIDPLSKASPEGKLIMKYINNNMNISQNQPQFGLFYGGQQNYNIKNLFKIQKKGEPEKLDSFIGRKRGKRMLLFHGSGPSNYMGIFSMGLQIAPPTAQLHGWAFGKGLYFADMFTKSANYCCANNYGQTTTDSYMLICEIALGKMKEATQANFSELAPKNIDTLKALGRMGPDMKKHVIMFDGVEVPMGECIQYEQNPGRQIYLQHNEYIVFNPNQVRMRYLIQFNQGNNY